MASPDVAWSKFSLRKDQLYYLRALCKVNFQPFVRVWKADPNSHPLFIPAVPETEYIMKSSGRDTDLYVLKQEVSVKSFRRIRPKDFLKTLRLFRFHRFNRYADDCLTILPLFHAYGAKGLETSRAMRTLAAWDVGVSSSALQQTLGYDIVGFPGAPKPLQLNGRIATGIIVHLHYCDVWPDFEKRLRNLTCPFSLIVTLNESNPDFAARVAGQFPNAKVLVYPNRGRDVGPFIQLLREGHLDDFELICKLHGKKTVSLGPRMIFGEIWRRLLLNDLVGSDELVRAILQRFISQPGLGLVGSSHFRGNYLGTWPRNAALTLELAKRLGCPEERFKLDFFAGTMFWVRRELLDLLKSLNLSQDDFPVEAGQTDGTLQHALERIFGALPGLACPPMTIEETAWPLTKPLSD
ncbi:rhamnan synthesis F family protein [Afipia sp. 1NLS2]|uniref:rhamnan synthesis F family protein n=1 Tax=Afipia sp. 1NLS2 TaxID=666684 RepID=UPI0001D9E0E2|nr:rhamnan synthesis F family protein [Afipia sp. 1NLS2]EFI53752.1 Rhamnan synthesis F [Afipia sp. 1NLS2]